MQAMGPVASDDQATDDFGGSAGGVLSEGGAGLFRRNASAAQFDITGDDLGGAAYGGNALQPSVTMGAGI